MNLKVARQIADVSQAELASRAGIDQALISRIEQAPDCVLGMRYENVVRICRALRVRCEDMFPVPELESK